MFVFRESARFTLHVHCQYRALCTAHVHQNTYRVDSMSEENSWKKYFASFGPGAASGWYCTEKTGASRCRKPSTVPSLRLMCVTSTFEGRLSGSTENP